MEKYTIEQWIIVNETNVKDFSIYERFNDFEAECKRLINCNHGHLFIVGRIVDSKVDEVAKLTDYFNG